VIMRELRARNAATNQQGSSSIRGALFRSGGDVSVSYEYVCRYDAGKRTSTRFGTRVRSVLTSPRMKVEVGGVANRGLRLARAVC
jgi:hypothetical protein